MKKYLKSHYFCIHLCLLRFEIIKSFVKFPDFSVSFCLRRLLLCISVVSKGVFLALHRSMLKVMLS